VAEADATGEGGVSARLTEAIFLGDHVRLRFAIGDAELTVKQPASTGLGALPPGSSVALAWQPHHAAAYCAETALP